MARKDRSQRFLFEPAKFVEDEAVQRMTGEALGAYARLFCRAWSQPEPGVFPDFDPLLASLSQAGDRWPDLKAAVATAFDTTSRPGYWVQKGLASTFASQSKRFSRESQQKRDAANARWAKEKDAHAHPPALQPHPASYAGLGLGSGVGVDESKSTPLVSGADRGGESPKGNGHGNPPDKGNGEEALASWLTGFDDWWQDYPRKVAREAARKAYAKIRPRTDETYTALFTGVEHHKRTEWAGREPDKIPHASTWLNQRRWTDAAQSH